MLIIVLLIFVINGLCVKPLDACLKYHVQQYILAKTDY